MKKHIKLLAFALSFALLTGCVSYGSDFVFDPTRPIDVISREDGSGTRGAFIELFGIEYKSAGVRKDLTTKEATIVNKTDVMMQMVAGDPYAIGYISLGSLNDTVKAVAIDGAEATNENVKNGSYTIARPFSIITKGEPTPATKDFIDFVFSKQGQDIVGESYISVDDNAPPYAGESKEGKVVITGSSSVAPVMEKLVEAYKEINPAAEVEMQISDSTSGINGALDETCDIGMSSRELTETESKELTSTPICIDGIAVVINNQNPIDSLTKDQVNAIYTGKAETWGDIIK